MGRRKSSHGSGSWSQSALFGDDLSAGFTRDMINSEAFAVYAPKDSSLHIPQGKPRSPSPPSSSIDSAHSPSILSRALSTSAPARCATSLTTLSAGTSALDVFAIEIWLQVIKYLGFDDCFRLRCISTVFRFGLRDALIDVMLQKEPLRS
jgi:hypothetical protein